MKAFLFLMLIVFMSNMVLATTFTNDAFNDSTLAKNLTFNNDSDQTVYLKLPINANITVFNMTLTGYARNFGFDQEDFYYYDDLECSQGVDEDWSSMCEITGNHPTGDPTTTSTEIYNLVNSTKEAIRNLNITFKVELKGGNLGEAYIDGIDCLNQTNSTPYYVTLYSGSTTGMAWGTWYDFSNQTVMPNDCIGNTNITTRLRLRVGQNSGGGYRYYESMINFTSYLYNSTLDTGAPDGIYDWSNSTIFDSSLANKGLNKTSIQVYFSSCIPDGNGNCTIPIKLHSASAGILGLSALQFNYTDVFVWANTTPATRDVIMPLSYADSFAVVVKNKGYFTKNFTIGCEGPICAVADITSNLTNLTTTALSYLQEEAFTVTIDPNTSASAGNYYAGNLTINGSGKINTIPLGYYLMSDVGSGGGGGGGGWFVSNANYTVEPTEYRLIAFKGTTDTKTFTIRNYKSGTLDVAYTFKSIDDSDKWFSGSRIVHVPAGNPNSAGLADAEITITYPDNVDGDYLTQIEFDAGNVKVTVPVYMSTKVLFVNWNAPLFEIGDIKVTWLYIVLASIGIIIVGAMLR